MSHLRPLVACAILFSLVGCASGGAPRVEEPPLPRAPENAPPPSAERLRPIPYPVVAPPEYRAAVARGTRTADGEPGPRYWQQWVDYTILSRLDPEAKRLEGSATIVYHNRSPDALDAVYLNLNQNFHRAGALRFEEAEVTGGVELERVAAQGQTLQARGEGAGYTVEGTIMRIAPPSPVPAGGSIELTVDWAFDVPKAGAGARMGWDGEDLFFLAYWYPQVAVYDDVIGWHLDPFRGNAEFYSDHGRYDVTVEAPVGWYLMGTGALTNADEVLQPRIVERLRRAESSESVVHVVAEGDFDNVTTADPSGWLSWRFVADSVRDVAFTAVRRSFWDAAATPVGDRDGDGVTDYARVDAIWRESAPLWANAWRYAQHSIDFLSRWTDTPYPWPHMTAVEGGGIIGGGMEFPMMTLIGDYNARGDSALYYVTAHELAHMWVPMIVSTNERRFAWFDEGTTSFNENQARMEFYPGPDHDLPDMENYLRLAGAAAEGEIMRWSDFHNTGSAYGVASYSKPATVLATLLAMLGEEAFLRAYHEYFDRWAFKHPYPWDFFRTMEDVTGRDLSWFWRAWYYESTSDGLWALDQAVESVEVVADGTRITVLDRGWIPMPVDLVITRADGMTERITLPVEPWLEGRVRQSVTVGGEVVRVEIDPEVDYPDIVRENNVWNR